MADQPLLILFLFPIVISAYLGGLGPGLLATVIMRGRGRLLPDSANPRIRFRNASGLRALVVPCYWWAC